MVGISEGTKDIDGLLDGDTVRVGWEDGISVGLCVIVGDDVGNKEGNLLGCVEMDGSELGTEEGSIDSSTVGSEDGLLEGTLDG